jgi:hypothetical protein
MRVNTVPMVIYVHYSPSIVVWVDEKWSDHKDRRFWELLM